ncbi:Transglutaminase-like superfamily protein [Ruminococcaceae bacterium YAD3003]|nr:Transglutaminase-like superfamily protein [Ruminococcaceae bacterium YAD3003]
MKRVFIKLVSFIAVMTMALSMSGCLGSGGFDLETTAPDSTVETIPTTAKPYVRIEFDAVKNPYFAMLDGTCKNAYSQVYEELSAGNQKFEMRIEVNADQLTKAIDAILCDHPELFWLDNTYGYTYDPSNGYIRELTFNFFDFADTPEKLAAARAEFDAAVNSVVAQAMTYPTLVERELFVHDYICENTEYDTNAPYHQSAYSALILHKSVCAGYTRSFQYIMQKLGATCYCVMGRTEGLSGQVVGATDDSGSHSWNMILIEGQYYNVDCLWDDTASETYGSPIYPFFNVPDASLAYHARSNSSVNLPICTATDYKYSNQFGPTVEVENIVFTDA